ARPARDGRSRLSLLPWGRRARAPADVAPAPAYADVPAESEEITSPAAVELPEPIASALTVDEVAAAADEMQALAGSGEPALVELARRLGLSPFERDILLLAVATELDPAIAELCAEVQGRAGRSLPTFGLALRLFDDPEWEALAPHRPLRRLQLVTPAGASDSLVNAQLGADERVVNLLKGLDHIDERIGELLVPMAAQSADLPTARSHGETIEMIVRWARAAPSSKVVVCLSGPHSTSKRIIAEQIAATLDLFIVRLPVTNLPPPGAELNGVIRLWERDSLLSPLSLYLDASDQSGELGQDARLAASRLLARVQGLVFVDSRETWPGLDSTALVVDVVNPTSREQAAVWDASLPAAQKPLADDLAAHFDLDPLTIHQLASAVGQAGGEADEAQQRRALWRSVLVSTRPSLDLLGRRAQPKVGANDLILPQEILEQIERIKEQVRHRATVYNDWGLSERMSRGLGISALFAGESGTGKTLAAEVIAADLGLDLYRIDLSGVVSKYIGETEKNLRRVFDAAEQGGTILCFDEADALFGKRSEVKDSHDRYANIEVNYLLQRMEDYRGLAILTTNMKSSLDHAFTRRIRFVVDFPFPGPVERERIWRGAFVGAVSTDRLDFGRLARLTLSGGGIHNVAVNATFAAASEPDHVLTMPMVFAAARLEYRKSGLPLNEAAFAWDEPRATVAELPPPAEGTADPP
ncbi:MAG: ATP-binding protein, partial [Solirubrobacteraceae bacterium]